VFRYSAKHQEPSVAASQSLRRSGIRAQNIVHCESDEPFNLKAEDIVKIFISDNEFVEVTHEQAAERVKTSRFIGSLV
jgi:hypothetical protein